MQVTIRLGRKARNDRLVPAEGKIGKHGVADEILPGFHWRYICDCRGGHDAINSVPEGDAPRRRPG
jgi:hypothetical protein